MTEAQIKDMLAVVLGLSATEPHATMRVEMLMQVIDVMARRHAEQYIAMHEMQQHGRAPTGELHRDR